MDKLVSDEEFNKFREFQIESGKYSFNNPYTKESYYYRKKFEEYYPNQSGVIPYFWLPEWTDVKDPSARKLTTFVDSV
jgi:asparagine synthase (glutamine-hydrolysing)